MRLLCIVLAGMIAGCADKTQSPIRYIPVYEITSDCRVDTVASDWVDTGGGVLAGVSVVEFHLSGKGIVYLATKEITYRVIDSIPKDTL